ncbi:MAG: class I SAM-dependent methyltransferase [Proteobacteria bacterium]|nr:class I SAM-dependent methyltransferase [Pseudomonadota bacterium]
MIEKLTEAQLAEIESVTLGHYSDNAESFWQGTRDHDVSQNYAALLNCFPKPQSLDILDLGCGPGRDLVYFQSMGHRPVGLDGSAAFCAMARANAGCKVLHQQFLSLSLPDSTFNAVFANASLFHVPRQALPNVFRQLHTTLIAGGILFISNPRGNGEGWQGERFGNFMEYDTTKDYLEAAGFTLLRHYYRPGGLPRDAQPWLATVSQKVEACGNASGAQLCD